jgi:hypothetical protein
MKYSKDNLPFGSVFKDSSSEVNETYELVGFNKYNPDFLDYVRVGPRGGKYKEQVHVSNFLHWATSGYWVELYSNTIKSDYDVF